MSLASRPSRLALAPHGASALHPASAVPFLHTSFAPDPPAISLYAHPSKTEQWQTSSPPLVTQ
jgi:hypothetical protein